ncbi:MAG: D-2-hydroxyacid dehydrogenase [Chloroflexota bacterium]
MSIILLAFQEGELSSDHLTQIQTLAPDKQLIITQDREHIESILDDIEIAVCSFPQDLVEKASNLRWFQNWHAGADWVLRYPDLNEKDIVITNTSGVHAIPISEHIMAFLLALGRNFPSQMRNQVQHTWAWPGKDTIFELSGKTMLLIGVGAIGSYTARLASSFGMKVIGVRRNPEQAVDGISQMLGQDNFQGALPEANFVVLTLPLTAETKGIIGADELAQMNSSAFIINTGRGPTIDQAALVQALQTGQIAGAGLDVADPEPLPENSPLWDMENVIITAHYSGVTPHYTERALAIFLDNLARYVDGRPLRNVVNKQLGY